MRLSQFCSALLQRKLLPEGGIQETGCPVRAEKGNTKLNRYRAYIGFLRGETFYGGDFQGGD